MIPLQTGANAAADSGRHSPSLLIPIHQAIINTGSAVADSGRHSPLLGANMLGREYRRRLGAPLAEPEAARAGAMQNKLELVRRSLIQTDRTGFNTRIAGWIKIRDPPGP